MKNIDKKDIEDILKSSKEENKKYLYKVLKIEGISAFDTAYIMSALNLSDRKIKLLEYSISKYSKLKKLNENESINEYIFEVVRNVEKLEKSNSELLNEIADCKNEINTFNRILSYIIEGNIDLLKLKNHCSVQNFVFSKIYIDK